MLIAWFIAVAALFVPAVYFLRGRVAPQRASPNNLRNLRFVTNPVFVLLQIGNVINALGNFLPGIYLPCECDIFHRPSPRTSSC